jgi:hypothetical protein
MEYNTCSWCGANDGRAGLLINTSGELGGGMCMNCNDTKKSGNIVIHTHLHRTPEELAKTMQLIAGPAVDIFENAGQVMVHEDRLAKEAYEAQIDAIVEMVNKEAKWSVTRRGVGGKVRLDMAKAKIVKNMMQVVELRLLDE